MMQPGERKYIGDGVYIYFNGVDFVLYTSDGINETNKIVLEPQVAVYLSILIPKTLDNNEVE